MAKATVRWLEAAFQECHENAHLLDKWSMVQAGDDRSVSSSHSEEPERSELCIPVKGLETNPQLRRFVPRKSATHVKSLTKQEVRS